MLDKEILNDFKTESKQLLVEITELLNEIENSIDVYPDAQVDQFALKIDRIMGASKTLAMLDEQNQGLVLVGQLASVCKSTGYKALAKKELKSIPVFAAFWFDAIEVVERLIDSIEDPNAVNKIVIETEAVLKKRLDWLVSKAA